MISRSFGGDKIPMFGHTKLDSMQNLRFSSNEASDQTIVGRAIKLGIPLDSAAATAQSEAKVVLEETRIGGNASRKCAGLENLHQDSLSVM